MKSQLYKNRYGDEFTFTPTEDGNILWEGNFEYNRLGFSNDEPRTINICSLIHISEPTRPY